MEIITSLRSNQKYVDCYSSSPIVQSITGTVERLLNSCGTQTIEYSGNRLDADGLMVISVAPNNDLYDFITTDKNGGVVGKSIRTRKEQVMSFPQYDVELRIIVEFECALPEEDLELFKIMGKVHTEVRPATLTETVFCETNIGDVPF